MLSFFFKILSIIFRERGKEGEGERNINVWLPVECPLWDLVRNPGMCPDWELNWRPFVSQAGTQSIEPHQPGRNYMKLAIELINYRDARNCKILFDTSLGNFRYKKLRSPQNLERFYAYSPCAYCHWSCVCISVSFDTIYHNYQGLYDTLFCELIVSLAP